MSLDVYLMGEKKAKCHYCEQDLPELETLYTDNITHNLGQMAEKAGLYIYLWRPDEHGLTKAKQLIPFLKKGLEKLQSTPEIFKELNPENGWGTYEHLVKFVEEYILACDKYPESTIDISR